MAPSTSTTSTNNDMEAQMRKFYEDTMKRYMDELQQGRAAEAAPGQALDLRSSSADLDHGSHRSENDSESWEKNLQEQMRGLSSDRASMTRNLLVFL